MPVLWELIKGKQAGGTQASDELQKVVDGGCRRPAQSYLKVAVAQHLLCKDTWALWFINKQFPSHCGELLQRWEDLF